MNAHDAIPSSVSEYDDDAIVNFSHNPHMDSVLALRLSRRGALKGSVAVAAASLLGGAGLSGCGGDSDSGNNPTDAATPAKELNFQSIAKTQADQITIAEGYQISILHALGDPMHWGDASWQDDGSETPESYQRRIGCGHDGMYYFGLSDDGRFDANRSDRGLLCVNHEYVVAPYGLHPTGRTVTDGKRPASEVDKEIFAHGASVVEIKRKRGSSDMEMVRGSPYNRRVHSATEMAFGGPAAGHAKLVNKLSPDGTRAFGMNNNCACGYTPWGTYLTCEENYLNVIGRAAGDDARRSAAEITALKRYGLPAGRKNPYGWDSPEGEQYQRWNSRVSAASAELDHRNSFNTFGWVVEIDPFRPDSMPVKRTALGRFNHEGAWPAPAVAGQPIVLYSGDDARGEYIFKYVSDALWDPADINGGTAAGAKYLDKGRLFVAQFRADGSGQWLELTHGQNGLDASCPLYPFADQGDVVMHCRLAADFVGATKMDRPEWGGVNPLNGEVYMTLTNNSKRTAQTLDAANPRVGNANGHIIRWRELGGQAGTQFVWDVFLFGARADGKQSENLSGLSDANDFSSPDGLYFDQRTQGAGGLLWIQTDDSAYTDVTNCMMLAAIPGHVGDGGAVRTQEGQATHMGAQPSQANVRRFLVGPVDCEITGVVVTPDGKTLFFNVQHPGEDKGDFATNTFTSHWPGNQAPASDSAHHGHKRPRSATVAVTRKDGGTIGV
ncbi:PhoX family phosphatase [Allofranklinella schreckenbergeri]|uniref:PhoX family phosphatase n=2 Tax=Allofranklinella schreckenbergeri TaxID=1076744 RepID=A0A3M6Q0B0_9BURK|nr:PhoX family phosphatase [Allofranklinella schreckenbergeri]